MMSILLDHALAVILEFILEVDRWMLGVKPGL